MYIHVYTYMCMCVCVCVYIYTYVNVYMDREALCCSKRHIFVFFLAKKIRGKKKMYLQALSGSRRQTSYRKCCVYGSTRMQQYEYIEGHLCSSMRTHGSLRTHAHMYTQLPQKLRAL